MKPYSRQASVVWVGSHHRGAVAISAPGAGLKMALYASGRRSNRRNTSPPELVAAAQAGSFSLTLANELGEAGYQPGRIETTATVTMESLPSGWTMTQIDLDVIATVPKVAACDFVDAALRAKKSCPISRALNANISVSAHLTPRTAAPRFLPRARPSGRRSPAPKLNSHQPGANAFPGIHFPRAIPNKNT
jgi:osmotically inducible protein OsmC